MLEIQTEYDRRYMPLYRRDERRQTPNGSGTMACANDGKYEGEWRDGEFVSGTGQGYISLPDELVDWLNGNKDDD